MIPRTSWYSKLDTKTTLVQTHQCVGETIDGPFVNELDLGVPNGLLRSSLCFKKKKNKLKCILKTTNNEIVKFLTTWESFLFYKFPKCSEIIYILCSSVSIKPIAQVNNLQVTKTWGHLAIYVDLISQQAIPNVT